MNAIETLMSEHRIIEQSLDALVQYAAQARSGAPVERSELGRFVTLFREFADRLHHGKEEDLLFVQMVENGFPRDSGPIAVMLHDHAGNRRLVGQMAELAGRSGPFTAEESAELHAAATEYAMGLKAHIQKEDRILYPMAESHLPESVQQELDAAVERFDAETSAEHAAMEKLADELARRSAAPAAASTPFAAEEPHKGGCSCGH